jgi:hypothetical protein
VEWQGGRHGKSGGAKPLQDGPAVWKCHVPGQALDSRGRTGRTAEETGQDLSHDDGRMQRLVLLRDARPLIVNRQLRGAACVFSPVLRIPSSLFHSRHDVEAMFHVEPRRSGRLAGAPNRGERNPLKAGRVEVPRSGSGLGRGGVGQLRPQRRREKTAHYVGGRTQRPVPSVTHSLLSSIGSYVRRREFSHLYSGYRLHCSTPGLTSRRCSTWNLGGVAGWPERHIERGETPSRRTARRCRAPDPALDAGGRTARTAKEAGGDRALRWRSHTAARPLRDTLPLIVNRQLRAAA